MQRSISSPAEVVTQLAIPTKPLDRPIILLASNQIGTAPLLLTTEPLLLQVGPQHEETISLLVLPSTIHPVVLGLPWLKLHSPTLDWNASIKSCPGVLTVTKTVCLLSRPQPSYQSQSPTLILRLLITICQVFLPVMHSLQGFYTLYRRPNVDGVHVEPR